MAHRPYAQLSCWSGRRGLAVFTGVIKYCLPDIHIALFSWEFYFLSSFFQAWAHADTESWWVLGARWVSPPVWAMSDVQAGFL